MRWLARNLACLGLTLALALTLAALPGTAAAQKTLRAAAVVNDEVISEMDLHMRVQLTMLSSGLQGTPEQTRQIASQVLRTLIRERLQLQEARRLGIEVTDAEVQEAAARIAQRNNMSLDGFTSALKRNGVMASAFFGRIRANLAWNKVVAREIRPQIDIAESEIEQIVERRKARQGEREMRIHEIFLSTDQASAEEVRNTARRLIQELRNGATFAALARQFSQAASAAVGGDLGWITGASLPEQAAERLRDASTGTLVGPINTFSGVHIFALQDVREIKAGGVEEIALAQLFHELPDSPDSETVATAEARLRQATEGVTACDAFRAAGSDVEAVQVVDLGSMDPADLPDQIRETIRPLAVGEPSAPLRVGGGVGVLAVCERQKATIDRNEIRQRLMQERGNMLTQRYMRDLRRQAFVDIRLGRLGTSG